MRGGKLGVSWVEMGQDGVTWGLEDTNYVSYADFIITSVT